MLHPDVAGKSGEEDFRQLKEAMRSLTLFLMKEDYEHAMELMKKVAEVLG